MRSRPRVVVLSALVGVLAGSALAVAVAAHTSATPHNAGAKPVVILLATLFPNGSPPAIPIK